MINWNYVVHNIQIASTKAPGGPVAEWILDGGWPAVIARKIEPYKDVLRLCAGVQDWVHGSWEPVLTGIIPYSIMPIGEFRAGLDPRLLNLIRTYQDQFVLPLRLHYGIKKVFSYTGSVPHDGHLFNAALQDRYDLEFRRQTLPHKGTTVIVDKWADATIENAPTLRKIATITGAGEVGVEGTVRRGNAVACSPRIIKVVMPDLLAGQEYLTLAETAMLPGMKMMLLASLGSSEEKRQRADHLTNLTTDGKPTPIHACCGVESLL